MSLPLLAPAQAQKHVTVNEALFAHRRADASDAGVHGRRHPAGRPPPRASFTPCRPGAVNAWAGGRMAIWRCGRGRLGFRARRNRGGGRMFSTPGSPRSGTAPTGAAGAVTLTPSGSVMSLKSYEFDLSITAGPSVSTPVVIPRAHWFFGVTGRVTDGITGTATSWDLGVAGDTGRFGTGLGLSLNSWVNGPAAPIVYWSPEACRSRRKAELSRAVRSG